MLRLFINFLYLSSLCGAALSLGVQIDIEDTVGHSPLVNSQDLLCVAKETVEKLFPEYPIEFSHMGSTDVDNLSRIMSAIHPYVGGAVGTRHGCDYYI